jgi:murein DD-endopeptidase MepM/ murein hydrolase activator NlpD
MHRKSDLFLVGLLLLAVALLQAPPASTVWRMGGGAASSIYPRTLLLTSVSDPLDALPETFVQMGKLGRGVVGQHLVKPRESLFALAKTYGSTEDSIRSTNNLDSPYLKPNQLIVVHNGGRGLVHEVREVKGRTEQLQDIAKFYRLNTVQKMIKANGLPAVAAFSEEWLKPGDLVFVPDVVKSFSDFIIPVPTVPGKRFISSGFGMRRHPVYGYRRMHTGIDMPRPYGTSVRSAREGVVIFAGWRGGYGHLIIVRHPDGIRTWYGHLSKITVNPGARVNKGQVIGRVGSSGISTGPHLHFEVRNRFGKLLNPKKYLF